MYATIENTAITKYPANPRLEHPNTSFPEAWHGGLVSGVEYVQVIPTDKPSYDSETHVLSEIEPVFIDGQWQQAWEVTPLSEAELAAKLQSKRNNMSCSRFQALAALHQVGKLQQIETLMETADPVVKIAWDNAIEFRRMSPTVLALSAVIGFTDDDLDNLFALAVTLQA